MLRPWIRKLHIFCSVIRYVSRVLRSAREWRANDASHSERGLHSVGIQRFLEGIMAVHTAVTRAERRGIDVPGRHFASLHDHRTSRN